ncbi:uncharacterized protein [Palaemon carinicauda]|uniref:uncharacterized protein n=1 Tax=Palaemon carinicauda TaxID=392227 RepID=UPI0035B5F0F6
MQAKAPAAEAEMQAKALAVEMQAKAIAAKRKSQEEINGLKPDCDKLQVEYETLSKVGTSYAGSAASNASQREKRDSSAQLDAKRIELWRSDVNSHYESGRISRVHEAADVNPTNIHSVTYDLKGLEHHSTPLVPDMTPFVPRCCFLNSICVTSRSANF